MKKLINAGGIIDREKIPEDVFLILDVLAYESVDAHVVGGAVRDLILGKDPKDFDIAVSCSPEKVKELFSDYCYDTGLKHGTVTVRINDNSYELTTFRSESTYSDGRHPDSVTYVETIEEDLARRDFTMNAIAYDPIIHTIKDPFNGILDIECRIIRSVGDPLDRFREDGLRCLRAIRFAAQLGFTIDSAVHAAINPSIESFKKVSNERVSAELWKIFSVAESHRVAVAVSQLMSSGILDYLIPAFGYSIGCEQNAYHAFDVMDHTLSVIAHCPNDVDPIVKLAAWFHDIGKPFCKTIHPVRGDGQFLGHEDLSAEMAAEILRRLKFSNETIYDVCHLIRHHLVMYEPKWSNSTVRRWVRRVGAENVEPLLQLYRADILGKGNAKIKQDPAICDELLDRVNKLGAESPIVQNTTNLAINGNDVMSILGIGPGKEVGKILKECLEWVTDNPDCNNQTDLMAYVATMR